MKTIYKHRISDSVKRVSGYMLLAVVVAACVSKAGDLNKHEVAKAPVAAGIPVDGFVTKPEIISDELEVTGTLVANQQVNIVSELTRRIVSVHVKEGTRVKQGDLLFKLDDADLQAQLERLHQQEKLALLNENRLKDLISHEAIAQQDYDEASTTLKVIQAQIQELEVTISKTRIRAPFNGQIGMINIYPGAIVSGNTLLTDIEDNSVVKVEFSIPEKYTNVISLGSEQTFTTSSDQKKYTARVIAKAASLNENTRTLLIRGETQNHDGKLLPGQSARLTLSLKTSGDALAVSSQALIPSSAGYILLISHNNKVEMVPVEIGQRGTGSVEITKGLHAGDTVITSNLLRLTPGAEVHFVTLK